jgi:hypothetical protein
MVPMLGNRIQLQLVSQKPHYYRNVLQQAHQTLVDIAEPFNFNKYIELTVQLNIVFLTPDIVGGFFKSTPFSTH